MNILVTGGAGFIGSKIAQELQKNHQVDIIDFEDKFTDEMRSRHRCHGFDISKPAWVEIVSKIYDCVVHCAAQTGGYYSLKNPQLDCQWNCLGTVNVVEFVKQCKKMKKVVYISSMAVYGEGPQKNEESKLSPISYYGVSKLAGEFYIKLCWEHCNIPYTILRLWNTYGAGQDLSNKHQGMLSIYLSQALEGEKIEITGSEERIRDFIHVDDVVRSVETCLNSQQANNQIINVCSGTQFTSKGVISEISNQLNKKLTIQEVGGYKGDQQVSSGCNEKLKDLGWAPTRDLKSGIEEFLKNL